MADAEKGGNALLNSIAHPTIVNPLAAYRDAAQTANAIWQTREWQAKQAAGQASTGAIDETGTFVPATANRNLAAAGPGAALAAQETIKNNQALQGAQIDQGGAARKIISNELGPLMALPDDQLGAGITGAAARLRAAGIPEAAIHQTLLNMPGDPAGQRQYLNQLRLQLAPPDQLQENLPGYGKTGTITGPDGKLTGYTISPQGAVSQPSQQGAVQGPGADTLSGISTITNPDGSTSTDTLAGHQKAGRVTPAGSLAPGYTAATASPAMVDALRGQEGTPDGRTSVAGARGQMQVTPGFFKQYAQPGESFDSKRDVEDVARRGIAALEAKYPNDPGRVATAYFSGEGNVAPPGSATPWKVDKTDPRGTSTSAYVAGVTGRYKGGQAAPKAGGTTVEAGTQQRNEAGNKLYTDANAAIPDQQRRLIAGESALEALKLAATGPGTGSVAEWKAWLEARGEDTSGTKGLSDAAARQVLQKQLLRFAQDSAKRSGTDLGLETQIHSNANTDTMLSSANRHVLIQDIGILRRDMVMNKTMPQNAAALDHVKNFPTNTDPRGFAWDAMTPKERAEAEADAKKTAGGLAKLDRSIELAHRNGVLKAPTQAGQ